MGRVTRSFALVGQSYRILMKDKELMVLPLISGGIIVTARRGCVTGVDQDWMPRVDLNWMPIASLIGRGRGKRQRLGGCAFPEAFSGQPLLQGLHSYHRPFGRVE